MTLNNEKKKIMLEELVKPGISYEEITNKIAREIYDIINVNPNVGSNDNKFSNSTIRKTQKQTASDNNVITGDNNVNI